MTTELFPIPAEVRAPLDGYLDAVELALLKAAAARAYRAAIVRDLETQLFDMLRDRSAGRAPTLADATALLARMDPPDAYAQYKVAVPPQLPPRRTLPSHALWAAGLLFLAFVSLMILIASIGDGHFHSVNDFLLALLAGAPIVLMIALVSLLGFSTWRQVARNPARHWGRPIAVLEMAALPILVLCASPLLTFALLLAGAFLFALHRIFDLYALTRRLLAAF